MPPHRRVSGILQFTNLSLEILFGVTSFFSSFRNVRTAQSGMFHKVFIGGITRVTKGGEQLASILIEMKCPQHGLERFTIKVIKRFNIASDEITPKLRIKPRQGPDKQGIHWSQRKIRPS